ncbi:hypothetical protein C8F04DRAFT_958415 [Mycena alexandri]|uniref:Uncharacterized protein n=1 Tax=Mycena alexandri TaxID=1745969 RepID=A0AAD6X2W3_9AGAR|nr:hypothetical protein C8F04DRAFT_958415 [Mycena alexandri]
MLLDAAVHLNVNSQRHRYHLAGVIYHGEKHFTSRIVKLNGQIWYYDGILTGAKCEADGKLSEFSPNYMNSSTDKEKIKRTAVAAIYCLTD